MYAMLDSLRYSRGKKQFCVQYICASVFGLKPYPEFLIVLDTAFLSPSPFLQTVQSPNLTVALIHSFSTAKYMYLKCTYFGISGAGAVAACIVPDLDVPLFVHFSKYHHKPVYFWQNIAVVTVPHSLYAWALNGKP